MEKSPSSPALPGPRWWQKPLLLLVLAVALGGAASWWTRGPREPVYQGQRLSQMIGPHQSSLDAPSYADFRVMGHDAVVWLAWAAEFGQVARPREPFTGAPPTITQKFRTYWWNLFHRFEEDYDERLSALTMLAIFGSEAAPAIPAMTRILSSPDEEYVRAAAQVLAEIGPAARPSIERSFRTGGARARLALVQCVASEPVTDLGGRLDYSDWHLDFLIKALASPDEPIRLTALSALATDHSQHENPRFAAVLTRVFIAGLNDPNEKVRIIAARQIPFCGVAATPTIPRLIEMLDDPADNVRFWAAAALGKLDYVEKRSLPRLRELANDSNPSVRAAVGVALLSLQSSQPPSASGKD